MVTLLHMNAFWLLELFLVLVSDQWPKAFPNYNSPSDWLQQVWLLTWLILVAKPKKEVVSVFIIQQKKNDSPSSHFPTGFSGCTA